VIGSSCVLVSVRDLGDLGNVSNLCVRRRRLSK
jgi:hypothetical protein